MRRHLVMSPFTHKSSSTTNRKLSLDERATKDEGMPSSCSTFVCFYRVPGEQVLLLCLLSSPLYSPSSPRLPPPDAAVANVMSLAGPQLPVYVWNALEDQLGPAPHVFPPPLLLLILGPSRGWTAARKSWRGTTLRHAVVPVTSQVARTYLLHHTSP